MDRYSLEAAIAKLERELDRVDVNYDEYARALASWIVDITEPAEPAKKVKVRINSLFE